MLVRGAIINLHKMTERLKLTRTIIRSSLLRLKFRIFQLRVATLFLKIFQHDKWEWVFKRLQLCAFSNWIQLRNEKLRRTFSAVCLWSTIIFLFIYFLIFFHMRLKIFFRCSILKKKKVFSAVWFKRGKHFSHVKVAESLSGLDQTSSRNSLTLEKRFICWCCDDKNRSN